MSTHESNCDAFEYQERSLLRRKCFLLAEHIAFGDILAFTADEKVTPSPFQ